MSDSTILRPIAEQLAAKVGAAGGKAYIWAPRELDNLPAAVVELPSVSRTGVDQPEDHLGQNDWRITYAVVFYFDLSKADVSQDTAADVVEAFVLAIDADQSLDGRCQEAKVVAIEEMEILEDQPKPLIRWPMRVEVLTFV